MIVPNCRQRITAGDLAFALDVVGHAEREVSETGGLLGSLELDELLESEELFDALLHTRSLLSVSPYFFYYVLVRQVFVRRAIAERSVADYVAALLSHFLEGERLETGDARTPRAFVYLVDLVQCAREARDAQTAFTLAAHMGDVALFLTGIFPDAIYHRQTSGRRLPSLEYYEAMGRSGYRSAALRPPPRYAELGEVLGYIAAEFRVVRQALNDLADDHFCMKRREGESIERLLRQALYGRGADLEVGDPRREDPDA